MALPGTPGTARPGPPGPNPTTTPPERSVPVAPTPPSTTDWPRQATDSIIRLVDTVRDRTAGPAITAARAIVYGTLIALLSVPLFVFLLIGATRGVEAILQNWFTDPIWAVYLLFGLAFVLFGLWAWRKARKATPAD